jgi:hypothetical protein
MRRAHQLDVRSGSKFRFAEAFPDDRQFRMADRAIELSILLSLMKVSRSGVIEKLGCVLNMSIGPHRTSSQFYQEHMFEI